MGKEKTSFIYNDNPVLQAKFFEKEWCERIHIVDLDAAFGRPGINQKTILNIRNAVSTKIELGGGIRKEEDFYFWFKNNIDYLIVGSLSIDKSSTVISLAENFTDRIYVSLDLLRNKVMIKGWTKKSNKTLDEVVKIYNKSKIRGYIFTDVSRDGTLEGINIKLVTKKLNFSKKPIIFGGGLSNYDDLKNLKKINFKNLEGIIAGKSFYSGKIEIKKSMEILNADA